MDFLRRYNIIIQLVILVGTLSVLAGYNYVSQKNVFLQQLAVDTENIVQSVRSGIAKFSTIKETLSLQSLVRNISLRLDIFEFRYLDRNGVIINSMFKNEIGKKFERPGFEQALADPSEMGKFYTDRRDLTAVLAISHPVYKGEEMVGIIDLAVDVSEFDYVAEAVRTAALRRVRVDITNLLNAIAGSIVNSLEVFDTVDFFDFLSNFAHTSTNLVEVAIIGADRRVEVSSSADNAGTVVPGPWESRGKQLVRVGGRPYYRILAPLDPAAPDGKHLLLLLDAGDYVHNEKKLLFTALATSVLAILFSLAIAYSIYRINMQRARQENLRLEKMVKERTREIERLSQTDGLTGLFNRRHLEEHMAAEFRRAMRYRHNLSLMVLDLDHFKQINDSHGHLAGDEVLRWAAARLRNALRETDFIGRYGGEEFVVVLPETDIKTAAELAEALRRLIGAQPVKFEAKAIAVTVSIGVSEFRPGTTDYQVMFREADRALYRAKAEGRNRVVCFEHAPAALA